MLSSISRQPSFPSQREPLSLVSRFVRQDTVRIIVIFTFSDEEDGSIVGMTGVVGVAAGVVVVVGVAYKCQRLLVA